MLFPISFCIPKSKIVTTVPEKEQEIAKVGIGWHGASYTFTEESEYYKEYQKSWYGITKKKGGWDCMRHYEILAQGCIPQFEDLSNCPQTIMTHFPKDLVLNASKDKETIQKLLEYTRKYLTTEAMASYVLEKIPTKNVRRVLFISGETSLDYQRCLLLHGFKELFGPNCHDIYCIDHIYSSFTNKKGLYGRGMTYACNLDKQKYRNESLDSTLIQDIQGHWYDIVIYGSMTRPPLLHWDLVNRVYKKEDIVMICGEDVPAYHIDSIIQRSNEGHPVFVRELDPKYLEEIKQ